VARVTISRGADDASGDGERDVDPTHAPARKRPQPVPGGSAIIAAVATVIIAIFQLEIPYFAITPGPAPDVLQLIEISGVRTKPVTGHLLLTTVSLHEVRVAEAIRGWFDADYEVVSRSAIIPSGETEQDAEQRTTLQMHESQEHAAAAALAFLGYQVKVTPIGARVSGLVPGAPATKVLHRGDVIVGADAVTIRKAEEVQAIIRRHQVGDEITLKILRGSDQITLKTKTAGNPEDPTQPIIGVFLDNVPRVTLPLAVDIESLGIGGPSAGLMYALGIVDLLDSTDLTRGRTIAGTGAIDIDGTVQPVGGIRQKVGAARSAKAELFLAPLIELREACSRAGDLTVIGVEHLKDAVAALHGQPVPAERTCR
jgi:Lon-like protease